MTSAAPAVAPVAASHLLLVEGVSTVVAPPMRLFGRASVDQARRGNVVDASLALGPQLTAVLGREADGAVDLAEVLVGRGVPSRGRVLVAGNDPSASPGTRARIGFLPPDREELPGRTVRAAVDAASALRGGREQALALGQRFGLDVLLDRRVTSLSFDEHRAVELWIALATPDPLMLVLFEPLQHVALFERAALVAHLEAVAQRSVVLLFTASPEDARVAGQGSILLERGVLTRATGAAGEGLAVPAPAWFSIWVGGGARALAKALLDRAEVRTVATEPALGATLLRVSADHDVALARAVAETVASVDCELLGLAEVPPSRAAVGLTTELIAVTTRTQAIDRLRMAQEAYAATTHAQSMAQASAMQAAHAAQVLASQAEAHQRAAFHGHAPQHPGPPPHPAVSHHAAQHHAGQHHPGQHHPAQAQHLAVPHHPGAAGASVDDRRFAPPGYFDPPSVRPAAVSPSVVGDAPAMAPPGVSPSAVPPPSMPPSVPPPSVPPPSVTPPPVPPPAMPAPAAPPPSMPPPARLPSVPPPVAARRLPSPLPPPRPPSGAPPPKPPSSIPPPGTPRDPEGTS